jgi:hypothetical protein
MSVVTEMDRFDRDVSIHFNATHAENVDPYEIATPHTPDQLTTLKLLVNRCAAEAGHTQVSGYRYLSVRSPHPIQLIS